MKYCIPILCLITFCLSVQKKPCWQIWQNNHLLPNQRIVLSHSAKGKLTIGYNCNIDTGWNRSFIIMDANRATLFQQAAITNSNSVTLSLSTLKEKTKCKSFSIYTVATPNDPSLAMAVRVGTVFICTIDWE